MLALNPVFVTAVAITLLSGAAATWMAATARPSCVSRQKVVERLAQIALLGATAIFALVGGPGQP